MLQAIKSFRYATRRLMPGDTFDARTRGDERILLALGRAKRVEPGKETKPDDAPKPAAKPKKKPASRK